MHNSVATPCGASASSERTFWTAHRAVATAHSHFINVVATGSPQDESVRCAAYGRSASSDAFPIGRRPTGPWLQPWLPRVRIYEKAWVFCKAHCAAVTPSSSKCFLASSYPGLSRNASLRCATASSRWPFRRKATPRLLWASA